MLSSIFQDKKERTDFFIAIAVIALFGIFIGTQIWNVQVVGTNSLEALLTQTEEEVSEPVLVSSKEEVITENDLEEDIEKEIDNHSAEAYTPLSEKTCSNIVEKITPIIEPTISVTSVDTTSIDQAVTEIEDKTEDIVSNPTITDEAAPSTVEKEEPSSVAPPISTTVVKNIVEGKDCRIIIGSYRLKSSRDSMLKKLAKTNYQVVTYREKGLNIVAIHHSCDKDDLSSTIKTVREKYGKGAFVTGK